MRHSCWDEWSMHFGQTASSQRLLITAPLREALPSNSQLQGVALAQLAHVTIASKAMKLDCNRTDTTRTWSAAFRAAASAKGSQSSRTTAGEADLERPPAPPPPIFCRCFVDTAEATAAPPTACRLGALPEAGAAPASVLLRFAGAAVAAAGGGGAGDGGAATAGEGEREWLLCFIRTLRQ